MVENIDTQLSQESPARFVVASLRRWSSELLQQKLLDDSIVSETLLLSQAKGKWVEFLQVLLCETVAEILERLSFWENVSGICGAFVDGIRNHYGDTLANIIAGFFWKKGSPDQMIDPAKRALLEMAINWHGMEWSIADQILTQVGWRKRILD